MPVVLSVNDAIARIEAAMPMIGMETTPLLETFDRVLATDLTAHEDLPPFTNSSMDGYAVLAADTQGATPDHPVRLSVTMDLMAGTMATHALQTGEAARIMTGAPLPPGADSIVPVEETDGRWMNDAAATLEPVVAIQKPAQPGNNVRRQGESICSGDSLLQRGSVLRAAEIGMLASLGFTHVETVRQPRVALLTSGDEVVRYDQKPAPGSIRDANTPALAMLVRQHGGIPLILPIARDTPDDVRNLFETALALQPDLLISTAGVSVGAADFTRQIVQEIGSLDFWRINLRPGKPLAFGNIRGIPFFGLPGNPVSALVTFDILVRPALRRLAQRADDAQFLRARTTERLTSDGRRSYLRVRLVEREGVVYAEQTGTQSSGALFSLVQADGLLIVPEGVTEVEKNTELTVKLWRNRY